MSTGANNKSLPCTAEFREAYEQIFHKRSELDADVTRPRIERKTYVMRCEHCDRVLLPADATRYDCQRCGGKDCEGSVDINEAPPLHTEEAQFAPIMVDRFYEGTIHETVNEKGEKVTVDLGSRKRHREYMKSKGLTTIDDYKKEWTQADKDRASRLDPKLGGTLTERKERREMIAQAQYEVEKASRGRKKR
jgi:hypothetical protein